MKFSQKLNAWRDVSESRAEARERRRAKHDASRTSRRFRGRLALVGFVGVVSLIGSGVNRDPDAVLGSGLVEAATRERRVRPAGEVSSKEIARRQAQLVERRRRIGDSFGSTVTRSRVVPVLTADTGTSRGDKTGEGTTAFTGLAQSPEANLFTGALTTSIPIELPPGRKNLTPDLTLSYSSSGGPSPYGYGWSLPLGQIERTTKWGVPNCDNPHFDEFVMAMPGAGAAELVETTTTNVYRPQVEQAYAEATFVSGAN